MFEVFKNITGALGLFSFKKTDECYSANKNIIRRIRRLYARDEFRLFRFGSDCTKWENNFAVSPAVYSDGFGRK